MREYLLDECFSVNNQYLSVHVKSDYELVFALDSTPLDMFGNDCSRTEPTNLGRNQFYILTEVATRIHRWGITHKPPFLWYSYSGAKVNRLYSNLVKRYCGNVKIEMLLHESRMYIYFDWNK